MCLSWYKRPSYSSKSADLAWHKWAVGTAVRLTTAFGCGCGKRKIGMPSLQLGIAEQHFYCSMDKLFWLLSNAGSQNIV